MDKMGGKVGWWARGAVGCVSLAALAWFSAGFVLQLAGPEADGRAALRTADADRYRRKSVEEPRPRQSFSPIFGIAAVTGAAKVTSVVQSTTYSLRGLFNAPDGRDLAMIESSGVTGVYREQDRVPGGETVAAIGLESVTLSGVQGLTLIELDPTELPVLGARAEERLAVAGQAPDAGIGNAGYTAPTGAEGEWRLPISRTMLDEQISSTAVLSPARFKRARARSGKMGLRVKWLREDDLLDAFGLRPGDVIFAVNGLAVDRPGNMGALFKALPTGREIVIDLERRKGQHRLVIPLSQG